MIDERRIRCWQSLPTLTVGESEFVSGIARRKLLEYLGDGTLERATLPGYRKVLVRTASLQRLLGVASVDREPVQPVSIEARRLARGALRRSG